MPYNFAANSFYTKKLCSRLLRDDSVFTRQRPLIVLDPLGGLWATYAVHLKLVGKFLVDSLVVIILLFSLGVLYSFRNNQRV